MTIKYYNDLVQGSDEWHAARNGLITASEVKLLLTPTLKVAANDKVRAHLYELAAQRLTGYTEPSYISDDMLRGQEHEEYAREIYDEHYAAVQQCGFITNDKWGFVLGCSPDGLVDEDGVIEIKSRRQKFQIETICNDEVPDEYMLQIQTLLLVTERKWCDFIQYSHGMPMFVKRVEVNEDIQKMIIEATEQAEKAINIIKDNYLKNITRLNLIETERVIEEEITL